MHLIRVSIELQMQQLIFVFYISKKYFLINFGTGSYQRPNFN